MVTSEEQLKLNNLLQLLKVMLRKINLIIINKGRWPVKSVKVLLGLLQNLESNATVKNLDLDKLVITHV